MLTTHQLWAFMGVLDKVDGGMPPPRVEGRLGQYLRRYSTARQKLNALLKDQVQTHKAGWISGEGIGSAGLHPLSKLETTILNKQLGEVSSLLCVSEELGSPLQIVLWLKAKSAGVLHNTFAKSGSALVTGGYRWTPPSRLTGGEARVESTLDKVRWSEARCLKATSDDLGRPPHPLEYILDFSLGHPGLKFFRVVCAIKEGGIWHVTPGYGTAKPLHFSFSSTLETKAQGSFVELLIYREPWSDNWHCVDSCDIGPEQVLAHSISWADFRMELENREISSDLLTGLKLSLRNCGVSVEETGRPSITRRLLPAPMKVTRWLRGVDVSPVH